MQESGVVLFTDGFHLYSTLPGLPAGILKINAS